MRIAAGAVSSSALVNDDIESTMLRPKLAPELSIAASVPTGRGGFRLILEGDYARSTLDVVEPTETSLLAPVTVMTGLLLFEGPLIANLRWQLGGGAVFYRSSERQGIFQDGTTQRWLVAGGLTWDHPVAAGTTLLVTGRIDTQEFITSAMRRYGYTGQQNVRRGAVLIGVERSF
ncbi:MAG: hypothetical protein ACREL5_13965 [Gemmatimonadales bacterium]